ncbi:DUF2512 family protein [Paenibacillus hamazuiensis]|uniref:DUF2512 family protein n=1 Tax=Paenibacillus hamazuiensis TaxID=2936508 RepID=UPI00200F5CE9|nr:DUF2512 family protein [Paenibacillus hamazuiensis]
MRFLIKLVMNGIIVVPMLLWLSEATFVQAAVSAVLLCVIAYWLGDQVILRNSNNLVASVADAGLAFFFLWAAADFMDWTLTMTDLAILAVSVGVVEFIYHRLLAAYDGAR